MPRINIAHQRSLPRIHVSKQRALIVTAAALLASSSAYKDPYPKVYPNIERPSTEVSAAIYTGDPARGGDRRGWVDVNPPRLGESRPPRPETDAWRRNDTIVQVLVASFRDDLCGRTLFNLFTKAALPDRLRVSLVQQNEPDDADCATRMCELLGDANACVRHRAQVRTYNVPAAEAKVV